MSSKKKDAIYIAVGAAALAAVIVVLNLFHVFNFFSCNPFAGTAQITFENKTVAASGEDSEKLREILYGKGLHYDNPSCGFREEVSVSFGTDKFMPANDGDGIVQNNGKYLNLSDEETEEFHEILEKYGVSFPCL